MVYWKGTTIWPAQPMSALEALRIREDAVDWLVLVGSGIMEAVWAIALDKSDGFSNIVPTVVFAAAAVLSMLGLG